MLAEVNGLIDRGKEWMSRTVGGPMGAPPGSLLGRSIWYDQTPEGRPSREVRALPAVGRAADRPAEKGPGLWIPNSEVKIRNRRKG
jgi:hypothetical protein